jgi:cellulose synthase/poly-beta-1,6-N-acetylglucosamine synthase-like glycosyltransferase
LPFTRKVVILYFGNNTHKITMPLILCVFVWLELTQRLFGWVTCFCGVLSDISLIFVLYLKTPLFLKPCLCTELPCIDLDSYICVNDASSVLVASGVLWFLEKSGKQ